MANISNFSARSGRMVKEDGTVVNIADLLAGDAEAVSESTYDIDSFSAMSGRMIREDGSVINIADEIANGNIGGGGGTSDYNDLVAEERQTTTTCKTSPPSTAQPSRVTKHLKTMELSQQIGRKC